MEASAGWVPSAGMAVGDRYRLESKLGEGGMGTVWLAQDLSLDRRCAIKIVDRDKAQSEEVRVRFQREARAAAQLRSDHVVDVFDHGQWQGLPFIVMEYLEGEDLFVRLGKKTRLSAEETYRIVVQVARALARAHAAGIVHRDIKPENVFLVPGDEQEIAKVLDFGIAKHHAYELPDRKTKDGVLLGTPYYMSPEQARGEAVDWRADLWSLGIIAFQCLTGRPPFDAGALGLLMGAILYDPIPRLADPDSTFPPALEGWWEKASARDREFRYQSAKELADALGDALGLPRLPVPTLTPLSRPPCDSDPGRISVTTDPAPPSAGSDGPPVARPALTFGDSEPQTGAPLVRTRRSLAPLIAPAKRHRRALAVAGLSLVLLGALVQLLYPSRDAPVAVTQPSSQPSSENATRPLVTPVLTGTVVVTPFETLPVSSGKADRHPLGAPPGSVGTPLHPSKPPNVSKKAAEPDYGI